MAQTKQGGLKIASKKLGLSVEEYLLKSKTHKRCFKCKDWKVREHYHVDNSRGDKLSAKCKDCVWKNGGKRGAKKGRPSTFKGRKHTEAYKKLSSDKRKGKPSKMKGKKHTIEARLNMSKAARARGIKGKDCHLYKDGKVLERRGIRFSLEYKRWRFDVFARDRFTCQDCGDNKGGNLNAHHKKSFADFPELRFSLDNGISLCETCHEKIHFNPNSTRNTIKTKNGIKLKF